MLIVSLWILAILTILAVNIGHRVCLALRLSRYHRDRLKAFYLTKAGINRAIVELEKDTNDYDALDEQWADNEDVFKRIILNESQYEFATVGYELVDDNKPKNVYGLIDEERKININTASEELLVALLERCEINPAQDIVNNILIWRGNIPDDNKIYENLGYPCKAHKFSNIEELTLVKGIAPESYQRLKGLITVYGDGFININTASSRVLSVFTRGIAKDLSIGENFADSITTKIIDFRNGHGPFNTKSDINITLTGDEETNIFNNLMDKVIVQSDNFLIEVTGNVGKIKSKVMSVYNRKDKKILYWHEG